MAVWGCGEGAAAENGAKIPPAAPSVDAAVGFRQIGMSTCAGVYVRRLNGEVSSRGNACSFCRVGLSCIAEPQDRDDGYG